MIPMMSVRPNEVTMTQKLTADGESEMADVQKLLEERATVQRWLARLEEQRGNVSERVLQKVRGDYERRLQEALGSLASHRRAIQEELDRSRERLASAEEEHETANDEREEARLRNLIGELDDGTWAGRESQLTERVEAADRQMTEARAETERLRDLLHQLEEREEAVPVFTLEPSSEYEEEEDDDYEDGEEDEDDEPEIDSAPLDLRETPVAIRGVGGGAASRLDIVADPEPEDTAPKPGLKCTECGYTNDLSAWFCGVCGADVG
jgi:chromosome segregation ATPase